MRVFKMRRERVYRVTDLQAAPYLEPTPTHDFDVEYRNDRGELLLMSCFLRGKRQIGFASMSLVVSASMRGKLEAMCFHNLVFRSVLVDEKPTSDWWEVTSALTMPPVCPPCELYFFESGKPFDGDYSQSLFIRESTQIVYELHYQSNAVRALEPFDCARSREIFGPTDSDRLFVISNRLYRFLEAEKARLKWSPVRINSD